jgi:hypothetical protein
MEYHSGYEREPDDWYVEPGWATDAWADWARLNIIGTSINTLSAYDPCCGRGTILDTLHDRGWRVKGTDLRWRGVHSWPDQLVHTPTSGHLGSVDFHKVKTTAANIISNPPYKDGLAEEFALHFLDQIQESVSILVPITFLASQHRYKLFARHRPHTVLMLCRRPSMPPGPELIEMEERGEKPKGGKRDYCWVIWTQANNDMATSKIDWWL